MNEKDGNRNANIGLILEAKAAGQVVDGDGALVQGATVLGSYGSDDYSLLEAYIGGQTVTGTDGRFDIGGVVPDQPVTLQAFLDDGSQSESVTVTIGPGSMQAGIELRFP